VRHCPMAVIAAVVPIGLVLAGCTGSPTVSDMGAVTGRPQLVGRVPGGGRPLIVGAIRNGKVIAVARVVPGGHFKLAVPPGRYRVGLWLPGAKLVVPDRSICQSSEAVTVGAGRTASILLSCVWH